MVEEQIRRRGIRTQAVLDAFMGVPRHLFVPPHARESSYADHPIGIGEGQTISQPYMVALMTDELGLTGSERVLEIGTGSGYQTAILSKLSPHVYTVERIANLSSRAGVALAALGCSNITFRVGDGTLGLAEFAPYDRVIVTAGAPRVPPALKDQLADGGILVVPVGGSFVQMLVKVRRSGSEFIEQEVCSCVFVRLIGEHGWAADDS